jgi:RDD family
MGTKTIFPFDTHSETLNASWNAVLEAGVQQHDLPTRDLDTKEQVTSFIVAANTGEATASVVDNLARLSQLMPLSVNNPKEDPTEGSFSSPVDFSQTRLMRIASPAQRVKAYLTDLALVSGSGAVVVGIISLTGVKALPWSISLVAVLAVATLYHLLFALAAQDTPGDQKLGLRMVNFRGESALPGERLERMLRNLATGAGLGALFLATRHRDHLCLVDRQSRTYFTTLVRR